MAGGYPHDRPRLLRIAGMWGTNSIGNGNLVLTESHTETSDIGTTHTVLENEITGVPIRACSISLVTAQFRPPLSATNVRRNCVSRAGLSNRGPDPLITTCAWIIV